MILNNYYETAEIIQQVSAKRVFPAGNSEELSRSIITEHEIFVMLNEQPGMKIVCTPTHLPELIIGRLISEGIIQDPGDVTELYICDSGERARVFLKEGILIKQGVLKVQSCCSGNQVYVSNDTSVCQLKDSCRISESDQPEPSSYSSSYPSHETICHIIEEISKDMKIHRFTSGTHSCYLFVKGELIFSCEDIGRHNALDKAIGYLYLNGYDPDDCVLFTTGRVPVDMIQKVAASRIKTLISKSVPTAQALEIAHKNKIQLVCRAWPDSYEIY